MANQPKTPMHSVRMDNELWAEVTSLADEDGITRSDVIREAVILLVEERRGSSAARAQTP